MCNFRYVPFRYKAVVVASGSFVWSIFLCFMKEEVSTVPWQWRTPTVGLGIIKSSNESLGLVQHASLAPSCLSGPKTRGKLTQ